MFQLLINNTTNSNIIFIILGLIGGLGIFLYGINLMGESLKTLAGDKIKSIIEKLTGNVFSGIIIGALVTAIIQSSSATTALSISLIRAGLMSMPQAIGIIMGANIGTTVTAFLFSFPQIGDYSLFFVGLGAILIFFFTNKRTNLIGQIIMGFGLLFYGMELMGDSLTILANGDTFKNILVKFADNPLLGLLTGAVVTAIVQSSSATTGIVQTLYETSVIPSLKGVLPILLGNNIGTTITAVIACLGGSIASRRAASFHVFFNVFGAIVFLILLNPYYEFISYLQKLTHASPKLEIAYAHLVFNLCSTFIIVWFVKYIIQLLKIIIPGHDDMEDSFNTDVFNERLIEESPILALESTKKVILHMGDVVHNMFMKTYEYIKSPNPKLFEEVKQLEAIINTLDHTIHEFLVKITPKVDHAHSSTLSKYFDTIRDLERIGDHSENMLEIAENMIENKGSFTQEAFEDLDLMYNTVMSMLENDLIILDTNDKIIANKIIEIEQDVDRLEKKARKRHTMRINEGICTSSSGFSFIELLSNLERIGDHCCNIAEYTINDQYYVIIDEPEIELNKVPRSDKIKINIKPIKK
ncbi:MAG TPA: Na/Pi cotransporter family protein [Haloplasmataceae bacterium]